MKKHIISTIVLVLSLAVFGGNLHAGTYNGGTGEPNNPYNISAVADWQELMATPADWNKCFLLTADIDLVGVTLTPVGNSSTQFTGVFDGESHVIRNAVINQPDSDYIGIFGMVGGQIQDLGIENVNITGNRYVGGLVGYCYGSTNSCYSTGTVSGNSHGVGGLAGRNGGSITSCHSTVTVSGMGNDVGGLVGWNQCGSITSCYSTGSVSGDGEVGGLVGYSVGISGGGRCNDSAITSCYSTGCVSGSGAVGGLVGYSCYSSIIACYSTGSVSGTNCIGGLMGCNLAPITSCYSMGSVGGTWYVGGLVGANMLDLENIDGTPITSCYSMGSVTGTEGVGGLVGGNYSSISSCYSTGSVSGEVKVGGLVGYNRNYPGTSVSASFWDTQTSSQSTSATGSGKTTTEMQILATFIDAGWDFLDETANGTEDIWFMPPDDYPHLTWELPPEFNLTVSPSILWPANHKMIKITPTCTATDICDPSPQVSLVDITANESGNPADIQISEDGSIYLCATRSGNSKARTYTLTYQACDASGNCTTKTATVTVPHNMRK